MSNTKLNADKKHLALRFTAIGQTWFAPRPVRASHVAQRFLVW